jgi:hypothetical protein
MSNDSSYSSSTPQTGYTTLKELDLTSICKTDRDLDSLVSSIVVITENKLIHILKSTCSSEILQEMKNLPEFNIIKLLDYRNTGVFMKIKTNYGVLYFYGTTDYGWEHLSSRVTFLIIIQT